MGIAVFQRWLLYVASSLFSSLCGASAPQSTDRKSSPGSSGSHCQRRSFSVFVMLKSPIIGTVRPGHAPGQTVRRTR